MDINDLRTLLTVLCFLFFMGIVGWAYGKESAKKFDEAAQLPFDEEGDDELGDDGSKSRGNKQGNAT